ncbi:MAG: class I SAM-dependent methyltransferase [Clostridiales bacterium]|nr:class I SAM-dependent methyltransferase [Clostridiales bacterium]
MKAMFKDVINASKRPNIFEYTDQPFWNDPHISKQMLAVHIDPNSDAASRNAKAILETVNHLFEVGVLKRGMRILDLGCGPGLYSEMINERGVRVVGIDCSENSIHYAKERSERLGLGIEYHQMDFFDMKFDNEFDVVMQIYGEMNTFSPENRDRLFSLINKALKDGGHFVFDVTTRAARDIDGPKKNWYAAPVGFWSGVEHIVLEQSFDYPDESTWVDQFTIIEEDGVKVIRNWFKDYDLETIKKVISDNGFETISQWGDLTGKECQEDDQWIGLVARKI